MVSDKSLLVPNVGGVPGGTPLTHEPAQAKDPKNYDRSSSANAQKKEFTDVLRETQLNTLSQATSAVGTDRVTQPIRFSAHATSRLTSRGINMGPDQMRAIADAMDKARAKGLDDTLILTKEAAFIVSAANRTVITAIDKNEIDGNVFTNIEGAVVMT